MQVTEAQRELRGYIQTLQGISQQLIALSGQLSRPENQDDMFECKIPCDLASGVSGAIDFIVEDTLNQAIEGLQDTAELTVEKLERRFMKLQSSED